MSVGGGGYYNSSSPDGSLDPSLSFKIIVSEQKFDSKEDVAVVPNTLSLDLCICSKRVNFALFMWTLRGWQCQIFRRRVFLLQDGNLEKSDEQRSIKNTVKKNVKQPADPESTGDILPSNTDSDTINDNMDVSDFTFEESESLSDIDDSEVDVYINTEEEKNLKTTVWEELNREYLEEQAAKEAAALAAKKAYEASFSKCSGDVESARQLVAAAAAVAAQSRKVSL